MSVDSVFQALGDPTRRALLERLGDGPLSVSQLAAPLAVSLAAVVQHLQVLEQSELIRTKKVDLSRPIEEILTLLKPLAACDKLADKSRRKTGCLFGFGIVLTIALLIVFSNIGWSAITVPVFLLLLAAVIAGGVM